MAVWWKRAMAGRASEHLNDPSSPVVAWRVRQLGCSVESYRRQPPSSDGGSRITATTQFIEPAKCQPRISPLIPRESAYSGRRRHFSLFQGRHRLLSIRD